MKKLSILASCLLLTAGFTFGQTQSFDLVAFGTNSHSISLGSSGPFSGTFTLTLNATVSGYSAAGFSTWLQAQNNGLAASLSLTSFTVFQFPDKTQPGVPKVFDSTGGADAGFLSDRQGTFSGDLGATANEDSQNFTGTAHLADFTFSIANLNPGTYILKTTSANPKASGLNDSDFAFHTAGQALFTITIVPEPATWSLMGLGGLGAFGLTWLRARRK